MIDYWALTAYSEASSLHFSLLFESLDVAFKLVNGSLRLFDGGASTTLLIPPANVGTFLLNGSFLCLDSDADLALVR